MSSGSVPVLYSFWRSSCAWRVRIALNLKGIRYELKTVDLFKREQDSKEFLEKSPFGMVPALVVDGKCLIESLAIIEYLEEKYPNTRTLLPGTAENRAKIRAFALQIIANLQPLQHVQRVKYIAERGGDGNAWARHWIVDMFTKLESALQKTAGKYAIGEEVTLVDVCIPSQVFNAKRFGVDLTPFPTISRVDEALAKLPEFDAASARRQPDAPENEREK